MKRLTYEESHKEIDGVLCKICNICNEWFPCTEEHFYINKSSKDGLFPTCKLCSREKANKKREENRDVHIKKCREWYNKNREYSLKKRAEYIENHKEEIREYFKKYTKTERGKQVMNKHSKFRSMNKKHDITKEEWVQCKDFFKNNVGEYCCAYCGRAENQNKKLYNQQLHKEHVYADGGNDIKNCIPSCKECNSKKHTKSFEEWYNEDNTIFSKERLDKICNWINKN